MRTLSIQGNLYFATFLDDHSAHGVVYGLKTKDQLKDVFEHYLSWSQNHTGRTLKVLHSDCGGEYMNQVLQHRLASLGIEHHRTMPGSPQQNGCAKCWNRTLLERALSMLHGACLSAGFWELAVHAAVHIYNRTPTRILGWKTPHSLWSNGHVPDVSYFRIFGCLAYVHTQSDKRTKLEPKSRPMTFVGYETHSKGYHFWDKVSHSVVLSRDVSFDELTFPHCPCDSTSPRPSSLINPDLLFLSPPPPPSSGLDLSDGDSSDGSSPSRPAMPLPAQPPTPVTPPSAPAPPPPRTRASRINRDPPPPSPPRWFVADRSDTQSGRSSRRRALLTEGDLEGVLERPRRNVARPTRFADSTYGDRPFTSVDQDDSDDDLYHTPGAGPSLSTLLAQAVSRDPYTLAEALSSPDADEWHSACQYELDMMSAMGTWDLVDLPPDRKVVRNKWVFKHKADGRYRARLVAKGFTQTHGVDYDETFSPVTRFESLHLLLALAALEDWEIHSMDVKSAFLNGDLDEEIYMAQPEGFSLPGQESKVCRLRKAIYGLKQASRQWNKKFHGVLLDQGFTRTYSDSGVYVYCQQGGDSLPSHIPIVILYVDDVTILVSSLSTVISLKSTLSSSFDMTNLGETHSYLGLQITRDHSKCFLDIDQNSYLLDVLSRFGFSDCNPTRTPLPSSLHLVANSDTASPSFRMQYQQLIGSLLYAMIVSRPDISYAVSRLAQYSANPSPSHLNAAQHVLKYLKGTSSMRLRYDGSSNSGLYGFSDSDWAECRDDRKSIGAYCFFLADGAISWSSRKQHVVSLSSTEAEYIALSQASTQAAWYQSLLSEIGFPLSVPITLHGDNKGSVDIANNPIMGRGTKHINTRFHYIRQCIEEKQIILSRLPSSDIVADTLTKPLPFDTFNHHPHSIRLIDPTSPSDHTS